MAATQNGRNAPEFINVRILRQDGPGRASYWERHRVKYESDMNVISVLQKIAAHPATIDDKKVTPVVWECNCLEEICGACTMLINGVVRQACSALVDRLLDDQPTAIELRPMTKFPVIRDLMVDRNRLFHALTHIKAWIPVDGYHDAGPGPRQTPQTQEHLYPLSKCMTCGCCVEACPQYALLDVTRMEGETAEEFEQRQETLYSQHFIGPHGISQAILFNAHPTGRYHASERWDVLSSQGGVQICGNAQNCVQVCPKEIPLTTSIAQAGRATTIHAVKSWFDR